jgi:hypothetical protein
VRKEGREPQAIASKNAAVTRSGQRMMERAAKTDISRRLAPTLRSGEQTIETYTEMQYMYCYIEVRPVSHVISQQRTPSV